MPVNTILGLFAKSPIKPLQKHIVKVHVCCEQLIPFFDAVAEDRWEDAEKIRQQIAQLEKEADILKREIRLKLPRGLFLPVARTDLLELLTQQDKIANRAKDISGRMLGRRMEFPSEMREGFMAYLKRCIDATAQAEKAIGELDELLETGFAGREATLVEKMVEEIEVIEHDTDRLQVEVRRGLFKLEKDLPPVDVMFLYQIIDWIGDVADRAQRVGNRLEQLLAR